MTPAPHLDWRRTVDWCPTCTTWEFNRPGWASHHYQTTGHTTHRRTMQVETFGGAA